MSNVYLPLVATAPAPGIAPASVNARGFGVGIRWQSDAPGVATTLRLLHPVCWYNWWWYPRGQAESPRPYPPNYYPMIWNPSASNLYCWPDEAVTATASWWFIGNEPINPQTRHIITYAPSLMANQARAFGYQAHREYVLCGEYLDEPGIAYCRELQRLGCVPIAWHWHIYPTSPEDWLATVRRAFTFDPNRPVIVTETALWGQPPDAQRRLMDRIMWALGEYEQLHAVMWYDSYDAAFPPVSLLTAPGPGCALTETGRHYVDVTR